MPSPQHLLNLARRTTTLTLTTLTGYTTYKSHTDPLHIFWDLDHTILCSVTPLPPPPSPSTSSTTVSLSNSITSILPTPTLDHFDQIDDDFPYTPPHPNVRTYYRPGAKFTLWLCSKLGVCHVYTAAQESYTSNIMNDLDVGRVMVRGRVLTRTEFPGIVRDGKDLTVVMQDDDDGECDNDSVDNNGNGIRLQRAILFDDRVSNFKPQDYQNGVRVVPFNEDRLAKCLGSNNNDNNDVNSWMESWQAHIKEMQEMARLVGIAVWGTVHLSGDVRKVVGWVRKFNDSGDSQS